MSSAVLKCVSEVRNSSGRKVTAKIHSQSNRAYLLVGNQSKHQHAYAIDKLTAQCGALGTRPPMHGCTVYQVSAMTAVYALANPHG